MAIPLAAHVPVRIDADGTHVHERTGLHDHAAGTDQVERVDERVRPARARDHHIRSPPPNQVAQLFRARRDLGAQLARQLATSRHRVGREQPPRAQQLRLGQVQQAERPGAEDRDRVAEAEAAAGLREEPRAVEPVGDRQQLGQRGQLVGQLIRHPEQARPRQEVHPLRPAAEQVRRRPGRERVAVVVEVLAQVVGVAADAVPAAAADDVGGGHDPVADGQRPSILVQWPIAGADGLDDADVLVPADDRVGDASLARGARVLQRLAPPGVLVGPADP
jgi:hypothetical protein